MSTPKPEPALKRKKTILQITTAKIAIKKMIPKLTAVPIRIAPKLIAVPIRITPKLIAIAILIRITPKLIAIAMKTLRKRKI